MTTAPDDTPLRDPRPEWNDTRTEFEQFSTIHAVFQDRVRERPDAVALRSDHETVTYAELDVRSTMLARRLAGVVEHPDQCVGVLATRSIDAIIGFLGVMKAGAAFVPLEASSPVERLRFMARDVDVRAVLYQERFVGLAKQISDAPLLALGEEFHGLVRDHGAAPSEVGPRSLCYVMYTSGTTGRPKGVEIEHRGVLRYVRGAHDMIPGPDDRVLHVGQIGFDASTYEIWGALCNGAQLVIHENDEFDPVDVGATIERHGVTIGMFSAGALHLMVDGSLPSLATYRLVISAGDVLSPSHAQRLRVAYPKLRLLNAYGPTETTVSASVYEVVDVDVGRSIPIGGPLANTTLYVLDDERRPVRAGEVGELYAGGVGIARGYVGLSEVTNEKFLDDPFSRAPGARLYRTGDLVRELATGDLEFLGRSDEQVKIRGYRIEPAEVAAVLSGHEDVRAVEVVVRHDAALGPRLIAYVVANDDVGEQRLRRYLRRVVPEYMVPSRIVFLDHLPHTRNGKVDREALGRLEVTAPGRPLDGATQVWAARAWSHVLKVPEVWADDDFFDLGGDSLLALQLLMLVRGDFDVDLRLSAIFDHRTLAAFAAVIDNEVRARDVLTAAPPLGVERTSEYPASLAQSQACFLTELASESLPYQANATIELRGDLDVDTLRRSLECVVARHEILRTTFPKVDGSWVGRVHQHGVVSMPVIDVRNDPEPDVALAAFLQRSFAERIDLATLPLVRWALVRVEDERWVLVQVEHHVVHDGWSFVRLVGEIVSTYRALSRGHEVEAEPLDVQYGDFARWQRDFVDSERGAEQLRYWRDRLAGSPAAPELVGDRPTPLTRDYRGASLRARLSSRLVQRVHRTATRTGTTPYMVSLAAFVLVLSRLSGEHDVLVGSGFANRRLPGTEDLLGMLVNTVVLRVDLDGDPTIEELLSRVRTACVEAFENQEIPFEEVVRAIDPRRRAGHHPLYDHLFSFHDSPMPDLHLDDVEVAVTDTISNGSTKADLNVIVVHRRAQETLGGDSDDEMTVVWDYATDIFDEATASSMLSAYLRVLEGLCDASHHLTREIELATHEQHVALLTGAMVTTHYERDATIDELVDRWVRETPDAVAIQWHDERMSYRELDECANQLAARLVSCGVGLGQCVAVLDERRLETIPLLLAILRCGAAYLGIDRSMAGTRLRRIIDAADVELVVSCSHDERFDAMAVRTLVLDDDPWRDVTVPGELLRHHGATDRAYVSFTSGSTGEPKGVEVVHRGVVRLVHNVDYVDLGPGEVVSGAAPLAFDASTFEIWGPLLNGARLVLAPSGPLSAREFADFLIENAVTTAWFSAGMFHQLVDHELNRLAQVRQVLAGGDVLSRAHVNRFLQVMGAESVLINGYGPSEGTTFTCSHRMTGAQRILRSVPIGRPLANTSVLVVDECAQLVPDGLAGELWIGGDGLARGYLGRDGRSAHRFVENPFDPSLGTRFYRSGDRVRRLSDGTFEFLGRLDRQLKIRGYRVEPEEIERVLVAHELVAQAYVVAVQNRRDDKQLVAYLVPVTSTYGAAPPEPGDPAVSDEDIAAFAAESLPRYMVPNVFVWLDVLPLRENGKVDVDRLTAPPSAWFAGGEGATEESLERVLARPTPGASQLENTLIAIWQEVLGVREIGLDDDFFDLGGHSLLAVELFAAIERTTGARLRLATIFEAPTVAALANVLRSDGWDAQLGSLVALTTTGSRPAIFAVTAGDGNVVGFGPLARRLGPDQPFYVLQPFGIDSTAPLHRSVEDMARHYVEEIRSVSPHGPYLLAGRCFGAIVAYELARQFETHGEEVSFVISIDSGGPLWQTRHLANGTLYDPMMNEARVRALDDGRDFGDVFTDLDAANRFVEWLREPVTARGDFIVNRYLYAAYLARPDVRATYPLEEEHFDQPGHTGLIHWAWRSGRDEMGMQVGLLPPPSDDMQVEAAPQRRTGLARARRVATRVAEKINSSRRGVVSTDADARRDEVLRLAIENSKRYRAGPLKSTVVLVHALDGGDAHQRLQFARWYGLDIARIERRVIDATHLGMLREPAVASLAQLVEECVDDAMGNGSPTRA